MSNNNFLRLVGYIALAYSLLASATTFAASNYTCPNPALVATKTLAAINQGLNEVNILTDYGSLTAIIKNKEMVKAQLETHTPPAFQHASILFQKTNIATYDVECAYQQPDLTFYMRDKKFFIGATDYYWYARGQGQEGPYAWCNGKGQGVSYCSFIDKPSTEQ